MSLIHLRIYIIPTNEETATSDFVGFYFMEIWKKIKDYPDYEVSNLGRVKTEIEASIAYQEKLKTIKN